MLPFVLARIFRPTFLAVFELTNFQLGTLFTTYGIIAFLSYLFGGALADKFTARKLMTTSLLLTAGGGLVLADFPSYSTLQILFGYWGFSTIFLFWAAMIKATRNWGGKKQQGKAFGFLEGGRGIVAASIGTIGVFVFSVVLPKEVIAASFEERQLAFQAVIYATSALVAMVGLLIFFFLTEDETEDHKDIETTSWNKIKTVLQYPTVWLLILIVLCAYVGYKVTDILSLYAVDVMHFNEVDAAKVGSYQMFIRPIVCISVGSFADKSNSAFWLIRGFFILLIGTILFSSGLVAAPLNGFFLFSVIITGIGTYGLRSLYFAAIQEGQIPYSIMGTAVGIISLIGYTPDIFMGPLMGYLLDVNPGITGYQHVFMLLGAFSFIGLLAALRFKKITAIE
ncbi:MFS transporter [Flavobacteriaceae bacterium]|nr:MFS transporter [Flavobacteriaceae bacterium]MDA9330816.1 MFS transporter [Flavobacteriaceae bacterium]MDA9887366.1 MFS transporter [Flavobacteriaceae bacterium]MDA9984923.1 MFS transporter [Flavobacteriaceae bacterium]MDB9823718.1 MFS transporter [Flavobacteriaceae bacterium]